MRAGYFMSRGGGSESCLAAAVRLLEPFPSWSATSAQFRDLALTDPQVTGASFRRQPEGRFRRSKARMEKAPGAATPHRSSTRPATPLRCPRLRNHTPCPRAGGRARSPTPISRDTCAIVRPESITNRAASTRCCGV